MRATSPSRAGRAPDAARAPRGARTAAASRRRLTLALCSLALSGALGTSCYDDPYRWTDVPEPSAPGCVPGERRCRGDSLERCVAGRFEAETDCRALGLACSEGLTTCTPCRAGTSRCVGQTVERCDASGSTFEAVRTCSAERGQACRDGTCRELCVEAAARRSNVGCEYWPVDLDNANVGVSTNAAAQQFAVVVSNPQPDVPARVTVEQDAARPGEPSRPETLAEVTLPPLGLRVLRLGPREVDGSPPGTYDQGTHSAWTRQAYRLRSSFPVVAVQFNPLENVNVFSNDASLLKPREALEPTSSGLSVAYAVLGWPQTIASTDDPDTNFNPTRPVDLRAFLTLVGTRERTRVRVRPTARLLGSPGNESLGYPPLPETPAGGALEVTLGPFEVVNLETDDFNADLTGTLVEADGPVVAYSGSEASDAPWFTKLQQRRCCADHLEEQLDPVRTAGKTLVATVSANRTRAVRAAGGSVGEVPQTEYFRVMAATPAGARVTTTLPGALAEFELERQGSWREIASQRDFMLRADAPILLAAVSPSQDDAGVPRGLPGGDPSFLVVPPVEQFRDSYVFLVPDLYAFDFVRVIAPPDATVLFDGVDVTTIGGCSTSAADGLTSVERQGRPPPLVVHRCQLGFPVVDPSAPGGLRAGSQNDGVHRIEADAKVGVLVDGFDSYVSYAYAAGTELTYLVPE